MGLLQLILINCDLVLYIWFSIEIQFNGIALDKEFTFVKFDRIVNPMKNTFLTNLNCFIYTMFFFLIKYLWMSLMSSIPVAL